MCAAWLHVYVNVLAWLNVGPEEDVVLNKVWLLGQNPLVPRIGAALDLEVHDVEI